MNRKDLLPLAWRSVSRGHRFRLIGERLEVKKNFLHPALRGGGDVWNSLLERHVAFQLTTCFALWPGTAIPTHRNARGCRKWRIWPSPSWAQSSPPSKASVRCCLKKAASIIKDHTPCRLCPLLTATVGQVVQRPRVSQHQVQEQPPSQQLSCS